MKAGETLDGKTFTQDARGESSPPGVKQGNLTYSSVQGVMLSWPKPGQTFSEGPNDVHTVGRNASATKPARFVVVLLKKKGLEAVLPAE